MREHASRADGDSLPDRIARCVLKEYQARILPAAKLLDTQWTICSGIVLSGPGDSDLRCIALGTGLKCLAHNAISESGEVIADSHAEILAGRSFRTWLAESVAAAIARGPNDPLSSTSIVQLEHDADSGCVRAVIPSHYRFHLYSSEAPCGDASMEILDMNQTEEQRIINERKRQQFSEGRTVAGPTDVAPEPEVVRGRLGYSRLGILRTKPGRPDAPASNSMSCSDKIARWNVVGIAGRRLTDACLAEPVYLSSVTIDGRSYHEAGLKRALYERLSSLENLKENDRLPESFRLNRPEILPTSVPFIHARSDTRRQTSHLGAVWWEGAPKVEALTGGRLQGSRPGKDGQLTLAALSSVSRAKQIKALNALFEQLRDAGFTLLNDIYTETESLFAKADRILKTTVFAGWVGNSQNL